MNQGRTFPLLPRGQCGLLCDGELMLQVMMGGVKGNRDEPKKSESSGGLVWTLCLRDTRLTEDDLWKPLGLEYPITAALGRMIPAVCPRVPACLKLRT